MTPRARHLIYKSCREELGGMDNFAAILGVAKGTAYKYEEPPPSGMEMPVTQVIKLLAALAERGTERANTLADELLAHFLIPAKRRLSTDNPLTELEHALHMLKNGNGNGKKAQPGYCPECLEALHPWGANSRCRLYACLAPQCLAE